jgi:hypothetical protein
MLSWHQLAIVLSCVLQLPLLSLFLCIVSGPLEEKPFGL